LVSIDIAFGGRKWLGVDSYIMVNDHIHARKLDPLKVKGRHEPVLAYKIINFQGHHTTLQIMTVEKK
jgi:hypothetical protein